MTTPNNSDDEQFIDHLGIIARRKNWDKSFMTKLNQLPTQRFPRAYEAARLINEHITNGGHITILTDYDMDGVVSGIVAYSGLSACGAENVHLVIPSYQGERNVTVADIDHALKLYPQTSLFITCDVGTNSLDGLHHAHNNGIDVIVTDHHMAESTYTPPWIVVNPHTHGMVFEQPEICGAQTIKFVLDEYMRYFINPMFQVWGSQILDLFDVFVGMGALADVMPVTGHTRHQVARSINLLKTALPETRFKDYDSDFDPYYVGGANPNTSVIVGIARSMTNDERVISAFVGLSTLIAQLIMEKKLRNYHDINESFVGYTLAPMINAVRRVEGDMADVFGVFFPDIVAEQTGTQIPTDEIQWRRDRVRALVEGNTLRQEMTASFIDVLEQQDQRYAPHVYTCNAPAGIRGLLAMNRVTQSGLPAAVVAYDIVEDIYSGSARSPQWCDILDLANSVAGVHASGHPGACGIVFDDNDAIERFCEEVDAYVSQISKDVIAEKVEADLEFLDYPPHMIPDQQDMPWWTVALPTEDVLADLTRRLELLGPYGHGFDYPVIRFTMPRNQCYVQTLGTEHQHIKITTPGGVELLWWKSAQHLSSVYSSDENDTVVISVDVELQPNTFSYQRTESGAHITQGIVRSVSYTH